MSRAMLSNKILGWIIISSVGYTFVIILILHVLQQDKNPAVNAISEYVDGSFGALMTSIFFVQSVGSVGLAMLVFNIRPKERKLLIGGILFILAGLGDGIAGLFAADPISVETMTPTGIIHTVGGLTRFVALAVAIPLLSSVLKKNEHWQGQGKTLKTLGIAFVVIFLGTIFILAPSGLFGLGQRVFVATALTWMFVVAFPMVEVKKL